MGGGRDDAREDWTSYCFGGCYLCRAGSGKVHSEIMRESDDRFQEKGGGWNRMGPMTNYCRSSFTLFELSLSSEQRGAGTEKVPVKHPSSADLLLSYRGPHAIYIYVLFLPPMLLEFVDF